MISEEFRQESHAQRIDLLKRLGCSSVHETEYKLRLLVNQCVYDIKVACRDTPQATRYETSGHSSHVKNPSQRLKHIEAELKEFLGWFDGGRRPRLRTKLSRHAVALMLGLPPFGKTYIAVTKHNVRAEERLAPQSPRRMRLEGKRIYFVDILSSDERIAQGQIELYSGFRTENGEPLNLEIHPIEMKWPASFTNFVNAHERSGANHFSQRELEAALSEEDFPIMAEETARTLTLIQFLRLDIDQRSKATIAKWARCEPGFAMIAGMLDAVWPPVKGPPTAIIKGEGSQTYVRVLEDLAIVLVRLVQEKLNVENEFKGLEFEQVRNPNHFLGKRKVAAARDILSLIQELRAEEIGYFIARHTISEICSAACDHADDMLKSAADRVSATIVSKLDGRLTARRQFLGFGADLHRGTAFKWCGRLDPNARQRWPDEAQLAASAFPIADLDRDRHLALYDRLVRSFDLPPDILFQWTELAAWAANAGRAFWRVTMSTGADAADSDAHAISL